jgi:hypothetical protein
MVFVFLGPLPLFPLPAFDVSKDAELVNAPPFHLLLDVPWYMVGANGFDVRHFNVSHNRELAAEPVVEATTGYARQITYQFKVAGGGWVDRATRIISGKEVEFTITAWGGNIVLVRTTFEHDQTYGFVISEPIHDYAEPRVKVTIIANTARSGSALLPTFMDFLRTRIKRFAIHQMMNADIAGLNKLRYHPAGLQSGDEVLVEYLSWVAALAQRSRGETNGGSHAIDSGHDNADCSPNVPADAGLAHKFL